MVLFQAACSWEASTPYVVNCDGIVSSSPQEGSYYLNKRGSRDFRAPADLISFFFLFFWWSFLCSVGVFCEDFVAEQQKNKTEQLPTTKEFNLCN